MQNLSLSDVSDTALFTLCCHAIDAESDAPILNDQSSIKTLEALGPALSSSNKKIYSKVLRRKINRLTVAHIVLRAQYYDQCVQRFVREQPNAVIINIACGLDNRFERVDDGSLLFFDLDLPEMIALKSQLFPPSERYKTIGQSVFDSSWLAQIPKDRPVMLLAEGLFMYCQEAEVRALFIELQRALPGCEIVFEMFNRFWMSGWRKPFLKQFLRYQLSFGKEAFLGYGISRSRELEAWKEGFELLNDWSYFDTQHPKIGLLRPLGSIGLFRRTLWTLHYRLH